MVAREDMLHAIRSAPVRVGDTLRIPITQPFGESPDWGVLNLPVATFIVTPELLDASQQGLRSKTEQAYALGVLKRDSR